MQKLSRLVRVRGGNSMESISWVLCEKSRSVMNNHVVHMALEWAKQVMVKCGNFNHLVHDDVVHLACLWMILCQGLRDCTVIIAAQSRVIAMDINGTLGALYVYK